MTVRSKTSHKKSCLTYKHFNPLRLIEKKNSTLTAALRESFNNLKALDTP